MDISKRKTPPLHPDIRAATREEEIVNEKIFGGCNHKNWKESTDKFDHIKLHCIDCTSEFDYCNGAFEGNPPNISKEEFLLTKIRKYSTDEVLASLIINQVESNDWAVSLSTLDGFVSCTIMRPGFEFKSEFHKSRSAAVCSAAAQLGAPGQFIFS